MQKFFYVELGTRETRERKSFYKATPLERRKRPFWKVRLTLSSLLVSSLRGKKCPYRNIYNLNGTVR